MCTTLIHRYHCHRHQHHHRKLGWMLKFQPKNIAQTSDTRTHLLLRFIHHTKYIYLYLCLRVNLYTCMMYVSVSINQWHAEIIHGGMFTKYTYFAEEIVLVHNKTSTVYHLSKAMDVFTCVIRIYSNKCWTSDNNSTQYTYTHSMPVYL